VSTKQTGERPARIFIAGPHSAYGAGHERLRVVFTAMMVHGLLLAQNASAAQKQTNSPDRIDDEIVNGGKLEFEIDILPNKTWGTDLKP
jgi:hypothetical protein